MRDYPIFNRRHAQKIMEFLQQMSPETVEQDGNDLDGRTFEDMTHISSTSEDELSDDDFTSHFKVFVQYSDSDLEMSDDEQCNIS